MTLQEFAQKHGIRCACKRVHARPDDNLSDATFKCCISVDSIGIGQRLSWFYYRQGSAFGGKTPEFSELLSSLVRDAQRADSGCGENSHQAKHAYNSCVRTKAELLRLLGPNAYAELCTIIERL